MVNFQPYRFSFSSEKSPEQHALLFFAVIPYINLGMPPIMLQQDVTARWNSMFCVLKSLLKQTWARGLLCRLWSPPDIQCPPKGFNEEHNFFSLPIWRTNEGVECICSICRRHVPINHCTEVSAEEVKLTMELFWKDSFISDDQALNQILFIVSQPSLCQDIRLLLWYRQKAECSQDALKTIRLRSTALCKKNSQAAAPSNMNKEQMHALLSQKQESSWISLVLHK